MAITVKLYHFEKRENSTKRPSDSGTSYSCTMIDETSLMTPTFKLELGSNPIGKNYCYVSDFNRYYFITDVTTSQGFWYISCVCDVLATYKTEIATGYHYVLRAASEYDEYISDNYYGGKVKEVATRLPQSGVLWWNTGNSYVVGITGHAPNANQQVGSVTYYQMDSTALKDFIYYLMHDVTAWCDIPTADYDASVQEALLNPIQYIVSCIALPVSFPTTYTQIQILNFGYYHWNVTGSGKIRALALGETTTETQTITIPKHPQAASRGKYMNGAPFNSYTFHLGPFGDIPLDPADYIDAENLRYRITYDLAQGNGTLVVGPAVSGSTNITNVSYCGSVMVGAPIQLAQAVIDPLKAQLSWETGMNNVMATGMSSINPAAIPSNLMKAQNVLQETYADSIRNKYPTVQGKGTPGSFLNFFLSEYGCYLLHKYFTVVDDNPTELGRPLCKVKQIGDLSGYILCQGADPYVSGTADESAKVRDYMNTGFFYE